MTLMYAFYDILKFVYICQFHNKVISYISLKKKMQQNKTNKQNTHPHSHPPPPHTKQTKPNHTPSTPKQNTHPHPTPHTQKQTNKTKRHTQPTKTKYTKTRISLSIPFWKYAS